MWELWRGLLQEEKRSPITSPVQNLPSGLRTPGGLVAARPEDVWHSSVATLEPEMEASLPKGLLRALRLWGSPFGDLAGFHGPGCLDDLQRIPAHRAAC